MGCLSGYCDGHVASAEQVIGDSSPWLCRKSCCPGCSNGVLLMDCPSVPYREMRGWGLWEGGHPHWSMVTSSSVTFGNSVALGLSPWITAKHGCNLAESEASSCFPWSGPRAGGPTQSCSPLRSLVFFFFSKGGSENQRMGRLAGDEALVAAVGSGLVGSSCIWERRQGGWEHGLGWG